MKLLFLTSEPVVESGSVSRFPGQAIKAESTSYATHSYKLQSGALPKDTYNLIKFLSNIAHTSEVYAELLSSLVAGGRLEAVETGQQVKHCCTPRTTLRLYVATLFPVASLSARHSVASNFLLIEANVEVMQGTQHLEKQLTLAGFVNCKTTLFPTGEQMVREVQLLILLSAALQP